MVRSPHGSDLGFCVVWLFIILVSVVDGYLVWMYREVIGSMEENPVGVTLLKMATGHVWLLLSVKLVGTVLAATWLIVLYHRNPRRGWLIVICVFLFQLGLLLYLSQRGFVCDVKEVKSGAPSAAAHRLRGCISRRNRLGQERRIAEKTDGRNC
ncbi:MAG: hypothetical protein AB7F89_13415 [Pirellulaceae bacterium]